MSALRQTPQIDQTPTERRSASSHDGSQVYDAGDKGQGHTYIPGSFHGGFNVLGDVYGADLEKLAEANTRFEIARALSYHGIDVRKRAIETVDARSFEWVWSSGLSRWLQSDEKLFWITGKAGSGKSTLMKHLVDSNKTMTMLQKSNSTFAWKILHFFYDFTSGTALGNTPEGMLRSWIVQLSRYSPRSVTSAPESLTKDTMVEVLVEALQAENKHYCVFVDGLDEYEGDLATLMSLLLEIEHRTQVKLCLASRSEAPIQLALRDHIAGKLIMQKWNGTTIHHYLEKVNSTVATKLRRPCPGEVLNQVADRADGVILWARLAFENILQGCQLGEDLSVLMKRLEELPAEVEGLYERALSKITTDTLIESALYLRSIQALGALSTNELLSVMYHANQCQQWTNHYSHLYLLTPDQFEYRISALCGALIVTDDEARLSFSQHLCILRDYCLDLILPPKGPSRPLQIQSPTRFRLVHETLRTYLRKSPFPATQNHDQEIDMVIVAYTIARQLRARWEEHAEYVLLICGMTFYSFIGGWITLLFFGPWIFG